MQNKLNNTAIDVEPSKVYSDITAEGRLKKTPLVVGESRHYPPANKE